VSLSDVPPLGFSRLRCLEKLQTMTKKWRRRKEMSPLPRKKKTTILLKADAVEVKRSLDSNAV
jgi:hypothetical protein